VFYCEIEIYCRRCNAADKPVVLVIFCRHSARHCCAHWQSTELEPCWADVETAGWHVTQCYWSQRNWQRLRTRLLLRLTRMLCLTLVCLFIH